MRAPFRSVARLYASSLAEGFKHIPQMVPDVTENLIFAQASSPFNTRAFTVFSLDVFHAWFLLREKKNATTLYFFF